jgi:hemerythrin-like metal-binding protein
MRERRSERTIQTRSMNQTTPPRPDEQVQQALDAIDQGFLWLTRDLVVRQHNYAYRRLLELDTEDAYIGRPYSELLAFLHARGEFMVCADLDEFLSTHLQALLAGEPLRTQRMRPNGVELSVTATPLAGGGYVYTYLDVTRESRARDEIQRTAKAAVVAMANFAEHRDADTGVHVLRVARLVWQVVRQLKLEGQFPDLVDASYVERIHTASILHDVGKISTPDHILLKPEPLWDDERKTMKLHTTVGAQLLNQAQLMMGESDYLKLGAEIALTHHEWFDGSGYPEGLAGEAIPLAGRICAIADVFDALTSRRPYKSPWSIDYAIAQVLALRGTQFDPVVTDAFVAVVRQREAVSLVQWSEAMSVGHPHIDEQHMILIDTINQLATAESQNDRPVVSMIIDELVSYAAFHFFFEERLMAEAHYPDLERHKRIHQGFNQWIIEVRDDFIYHRRPQVGQRILAFLRDWLRNHILAEDRLYVPCIAIQQAADTAQGLR